MTPIPRAPKALLTSALVVTALSAPLLASPVATQAAPVSTSRQLAVNGSFDKGVEGWRTNQEYTELATSRTAKAGGAAAVISSRPGTTAVLNDKRNTVTRTTKGTRYAVSAWVRTDLPRLSGQLRLREVTATGATSSGPSFWLTDRSWHQVAFSYTAQRDGAQLDLNVLAWKVKKAQRLYVDSVSMTTAAPSAAPTPPPASPPGGLLLSNKAPLSARGVPATGSALFGSAVGSNTDPAAFEKEIGQRLGVRRTYWRADQVNRAVDVARADLAAGRLPWISFKLPHAWDQMAAGAGDAWVTDLSNRLAALPGPVWIAFHHEPEGDGVIADWTAMQERLGPIVRRTAPNVAFTVVLTGWNQLYGPSQYALASLWPATKVDVAGFDVYNSYGTVKNGKTATKHTDMRGSYFEPISAWARSKGVAWGLAETGYNDQAAADDPQWLHHTYADLVATGGVAFTYFNTALNSSSSWVITTEAKTAQFSSAIKASPTFPRLG